MNDACGHNVGDQLLIQIGALLKSKVRWRDTLARLGGDEFGVLLESCTMDEALRTAEQLREAISEFRFTWDDRTFRLGVSIGVVPITAATDDVAALLTAADSACAAAKDAGRNRVYNYQENDIDLMKRRKEMQWAARISNALDENRFELFRQTIQPLQANGEPGAHYELLIRMRDEAGQLIAPGLFITAAERYGLMTAIDRWVIAQAFTWLVSEADERERLSLCSINLSGQSLADEKFLPFVIEQFQKSGLSGASICFEITETAAIASYSQANRFIHAVKELGCRFALDDFGTGLSSFGYLKHFPVDFLKIDGSFVKEILHDPIDREMVRSINEIGHLTGKRTIAEFAENQEIITMLRGMGVDYAQGYGVSEPKLADPNRSRLAASIAHSKTCSLSSRLAAAGRVTRVTKRIERSIARTFLVSAPTEAKSTPVAAIARKRVGAHAAGGLELGSAAGASVAAAHRFAHVREREVVEHDAVGVRRERLVELRQRLDLDFDHDVRRALSRGAYGLRHAADGRDVVFLDQDRVEQADAVIRAAATKHRVLLRET